MEESIDHFIDENGERIDIEIIDRDDYVGLNADRKLRSAQQPVVTYLEDLPSTQNNSNLFIDIARYMLSEG